MSEGGALKRNSVDKCFVQHSQTYRLNQSARDQSHSCLGIPGSNAARAWGEPQLACFLFSTPPKLSALLYLTPARLPLPCSRKKKEPPPAEPPGSVLEGVGVRQNTADTWIVSFRYQDKQCSKLLMGTNATANQVRGGGRGRRLCVLACRQLRASWRLTLTTK